MELDFDKEIDTLLRKARSDGPVYVGDIASPHLDVDEISAFAENAMPEKSRALYMAHLADCDRCRKILSNLLVMNAEAVPAAASPSTITIAERAEQPWYRRLLLFPNLAYVMGSLVLIFGGFLAFSVIQNSRMGGEAMLSQAPEPTETRGGPNFQDEVYSVDSNSTANASANVATANIPSAAANANSAIAPERSPRNVGAGENNFALDGYATSDLATVPAPAPPAAAPQPAPKDARERDDLAKAKPEEKAAGAQMQESAKNVPMPKQFPDTSSQSGPMRNNESQYNRQLENLNARSRAAKRSDKRDEDASSGGRKVVSGRTFERKQGVWYDTAYHGRPTINVRRGSDEFNRLDGGLRSIANSLSGTIVVVWGAKAYRIQ